MGAQGDTCLDLGASELDLPASTLKFYGYDVGAQGDSYLDLGASELDLGASTLKFGVSIPDLGASDLHLASGP